MSLTLKFEDEGYLPGLAHLLVQNLQKNPAAELLGVEAAPQGAGREVVFGLDGEQSADDRLLITDLEVLLAAREYCNEHAADFRRELGKHLRATAYIIDQQSTPAFASSRQGPQGQD